jgi:hypothetical protein
VWAGSYPTPLDLRAPTPDAVIRFDYRFSNLDWVLFDRFFRKAEERYASFEEEGLRRIAANKTDTP